MVTLGHERTSSSSRVGRRTGFRRNGWRCETPTWRNNIVGSPDSVVLQCPWQQPRSAGAFQSISPVRKPLDYCPPRAERQAFSDIVTKAGCETICFPHRHLGGTVSRRVV